MIFARRSLLSAARIAQNIHAKPRFMSALAPNAGAAADEAVKAKLLELTPTWQDLSEKLPNHVENFQEATQAEMTVRQLMDAGVHLGHTTEVWHRNALPFVYGRRAGIHIINLEHTLVYLRRAMNVAREIARRGGTILFVGNRPFLSDILVQAAQHCNQFYVNRPWLEGCLENHQQTLRSASPDGALIQPDLIVVLDMQNSEACLDEALRVHVPTIGLVDTDCDPSLVTYPVPGNDDSTASVQLIAAMLANAARDGTLARLRAIQQQPPQQQQQSTANRNRRQQRRDTQ